ncbi:MAG: rod shape-determining protein MreD [Eubacterium sp.]|nr:rod shape-determining protein MreD [Eubacterium sp.]
MRRKITVLLIVLICFLLQTTLFQSISFLTVAPNLLIIVTASFGFMRGKKEGMYIGLLCGVLVDIFYSHILGGYALLFMYIGYMNGFFRKLFFPEDFKLPMFLIATSDFIYNFVIYFFLFLFRNRLNFAYYLSHIILPELVYTLLMMIVLYFIILKINRHLEEIEKRSAAKFV